MATSETPSGCTMPPAVVHDVSVIQARFPGIAEKIIELWGSAELNHFFDSLMFDGRGSRTGFPDEVSPALMRVYETHITLVPTTREGDIWDHFLKGL